MTPAGAAAPAGIIVSLRGLVGDLVSFWALWASDVRILSEKFEVLATSPVIQTIDELVNGFAKWRSGLKSIMRVILIIDKMQVCTKDFQ